MRRTYIILFSILSLAIFSYTSEFESNFNRWLNNDIESDKFIAIIDSTIDDVVNLERSYKSRLLLARLYLIMGRVYYTLKNSDSSIESFLLAIEYAEESITFRESSEAWSIKAEASSGIMIHKGTSYIIKNSKKINEYAQRSIDLNSKNIKANYIIAQGLINAPKIFGGNKVKGFKVLKDLLEYDTITEVDRFDINMTLSRSLLKSKKATDANKYCLDALQIYPGNLKARRLLKEISSSIN